MKFVETCFTVQYDHWKMFQVRLSSAIWCSLLGKHLDADQKETLPIVSGSSLRTGGSCRPYLALAALASSFALHAASATPVLFHENGSLVNPACSLIDWLICNSLLHWQEEPSFFHKPKGCSSSSSQGTCLVCGFGPQGGHAWEAALWCLSLTSMFLSLSLSLPSLLSEINKHVLSWGLKIFWLIF